MTMPARDGPRAGRLVQCKNGPTAAAAAAAADAATSTSVSAADIAAAASRFPLHNPGHFTAYFTGVVKLHVVPNPIYREPLLCQ